MPLTCNRLWTILCVFLGLLQHAVGQDAEPRDGATTPVYLNDSLPSVTNTGLVTAAVTVGVLEPFAFGAGIWLDDRVLVSVKYNLMVTAGGSSTYFALATGAGIVVTWHHGGVTLPHPSVLQWMTSTSFSVVEHLFQGNNQEYETNPWSFELFLGNETPVRGVRVRWDIGVSAGVYKGDWLFAPVLKIGAALTL
jgi:hypothetical protein